MRDNENVIQAEEIQLQPEPPLTVAPVEFGTDMRFTEELLRSEYGKGLAKTLPEARQYLKAVRPRELCNVWTEFPHPDAPQEITRVGCILPDGHEILHFDPVYGDWAEGDSRLRPYSPADHLRRRLYLAPGHQNVAEDSRLLREYAQDVAAASDVEKLDLARQVAALVKELEQVKKCRQTDLRQLERQTIQIRDMEADVAELRALEQAGVDNWEGYSHAMSLLRDDEDE